MREHKSLYELTGDIKDINTMLINRNELNDLITRICEAYVVVGSMLTDLDQLETDHGQAILDNLSFQEEHREVLPWPSFKTT